MSATPEGRKTVEMLLGLGFQPRAPVEAAVFADPTVRDRWFPRGGDAGLCHAGPRQPQAPGRSIRQNPGDFDQLWTGKPAGKRTASSN